MYTSEGNYRRGVRDSSCFPSASLVYLRVSSVFFKLADSYEDCAAPDATVRMWST